MNIDWLTAWPQVGDAPDYLWQGEDCAFENQCFHRLRPVISMLWFSLPHRLGLPSTSILILHALLFICSIALSVMAINRMIGRPEYKIRTQIALVTFASACIQGVLLWPTFFHSLTDTPAALIMLCAISLLIILQTSKIRFIGLGYFFAGLLLGFSEGLRIFYLYPLLGFLGLFTLINILKKNTEWRKLYILSALLPITLQNFATYSFSGEITHMPTSPEFRFWSNIHRHSTYTGYDTLIPEQGYPWYKGPCIVHQGILASWEKHDWQQLSCIFAGRLFFLLGSYSSKTYFEINDIPFTNLSMPDNLTTEARAKWQDPYSQDAWAFNSKTSPVNTPWQIALTATLPPKTSTFAITTRSDEVSTKLKIDIRRSDGSVLTEKWIPMTKNPLRHFLHADISSKEQYTFTISADPLLHSSPFYFEAGDIRLTPTTAEEPYPADPEKIRSWSIVMFFIQVILLLFFIASILKFKNDFLPIAALPMLIIAQSLIIIPEQRFVIIPQICIWLFAMVFFIFGKRKLKSTYIEKYH